ncbi:ATP-binding protein [Chloroflexota bacterium]
MKIITNWKLAKERNQIWGRLMACNKTLVTYLIIFFIAIASALRFLMYYRGQPFQWTVTGLLAAFLLLLVVEPWLTRRSHRYTHLYLVVQTGITVALALVPPRFDFFAPLYITLTLQAMHVFRARTGFQWIGVFTVLMTILTFYGQGWSRGLPIVLIMTGAYFFFGFFVTALRQAEDSRDENQKLFTELQVAHQQLQVYAAQAEELAVATERRRAQEKLETAYAFQQSIIDGVADSIMVIDVDYRVKLINRAAREFSSALIDTSKPLFCYQVYWQRDKPCGGKRYPCPLRKVRESGRPVTVVHEHYRVNEERQFLEVIAAPLLGTDGTFQGIIESGRDITERKQAEHTLQQYTERLRAMASQLAELAETERQQLARELHDQVGQNLTALGIDLNIIKTQMQEKMPASVLSLLDDSLLLVEQTTEQIRDVMSTLRPPVLDEYGLVAALHWYGEQYTRRTKIEVSVEGEEPVPRLAARVENTLFRIAQEALTNVAKHAQATKVMVTIEVEDKTSSMVVTDDGIGFDPAHLPDSDAGRRFGLLTMKERTEAVHGDFHIESSPGSGTRLTVAVAR